MCNPRRIRLRATRTIAEEWRAEIVRTAAATGTATGEARLTQPLGDMLSPGLLRGFERAINADPAWDLVDDTYRCAVPGGHGTYHPDSGELEIIVQISSEVSAEGRGERVVTGTVEETVHAEVVRTYYTDGWQGSTKGEAQRAGQADANAEAARMARERADFVAQQARDRASDALAGSADDVQRAAALDAEQRLAAARAEATDRLNQQAATQIDEIHRQTLRVVMRTAAAGCQQVLLDYARRHGAQNIAVTDTDGVIEVQFEMEA